MYIIYMIKPPLSMYSYHVNVTSRMTTDTAAQLIKILAADEGYVKRRELVLALILGVVHGYHDNYITTGFRKYTTGIHQCCVLEIWINISLLECFSLRCYVFISSPRV